MRLASACERRNEDRIAATGCTHGCGAVNDQVEAPAVVGGDAWCSGVDEPLLGHHVSLRPDGFASNFAPNPFNKFGPPSQEACPRTRECVAECINAAAARRFRGAPATARREQEWKPEPAT